MDKLIESLTSPVWWFTVVIVGIAINLFSAYLKTKLDDRLSALSSWWRNRSEKRKAEFEDDVQKLISSPQEQIFAYYQELSQWSFTNFYLILATQVLVILFSFIDQPSLKIISGIIFGTVILIAMRYYTGAWNIRMEIHESQDRQNRQTKPNERQKF